MFSVIVIVIEVIAILFIGIFARTDQATDSSNSYLLSGSLILLLGFTLLYTPYRKLSMTSLTLLLIVVALASQIQLLAGMFFDSCFDGFSANYQITIARLVRCVQCSLAVLLTILDFIGLFCYWQVYILIAIVLAIGFGLGSSLFLYALDAFDGGGGITIFFYSGVASLVIWIMCIRSKIQLQRLKHKQSYLNQTLSIIGVIIAFISWAKFNMAGALVSYTYSASVDKVTTTTLQASMMNSAAANTYLGLAAAVLLSIVFSSKDTKQQKMKIQLYIDCFMNGGIIIASFQDVLLNPSASILMASFASVITLVVHKYFLTQSQTQSQGTFKKIMRNYSKIMFRIVFSLIGIIISSIVIATRSGLSPSLLSVSYSKIAGFQIVGFILVLIISGIFGAIAGASVNLFINSKANEKEQGRPVNIQYQDLLLFHGLSEECHPFYYDIFQNINKKENQGINMAQYTTRVIKESLLIAQQNPLRVMSVTKNAETKINPDEARLKISKDFSKSNFKNQNVSAMKRFSIQQEYQSDQSKKQEEEIAKPKIMPIQKSQLKIGEDEKLPRASKRSDVVRKLQYDQDSQIKKEDGRVNPVRQ